MFLTPPGNEAGVVTVRLLTMDRVKLFVVKSRGIVLSVARMVTFDVPTVVGVPLIVPDALSVNPCGSAPDEIDQVYEPDPPVASMISE